MTASGPQSRRMETAMPKEILDINSLMDNVSVKNRIVDGSVRILYDGKTVEWGPGQVRQMPRKLADWFQAKSLYHFNPGDINEGISAKSEYKLVILNVGQDESDVTKAEVAAVKELLDVDNMPETRMIDPATGKLLRRVYIDPRSTGARDRFTAKERAVTRKVSSAIVSDAAEQIAEAAQGLSEADIAEGVKAFAKDAAGPVNG